MTPNDRLLLLAVLACVLGTLVVILAFQLRLTPVERERRRRIKLNLLGRMGDGILTDVTDSAVYYCYSVHGVSYHASQDLSALRNLIPADHSLIVGPLTLKYLVRNPANSIVICENWSGLRIRPKPVSTLTRKEPSHEET